MKSEKRKLKSEKPLSYQIIPSTPIILSFPTTPLAPDLLSVKGY